MSGRRWLATMVRARQAQEDLAAQQLASARRDEIVAASQLRVETQRVAGLGTHDRQDIRSFQATGAAARAAAATLAAVTNRQQFAASRVVAGADQLTAAARARRTVEKLQENDTLAATVAGLQRAQRDLDEVSITRHNANVREAVR